MTSQLCLIDGSGLIYRAYHALPKLRRRDGTPVNAVLGFCRMMFTFLRQSEADHLAVVFDAPGPSFRNDIYAGYKANRGTRPDDLAPQFGLVRAATRAFGVRQIELVGYEADDLIATYARHAAEAGIQVTIMSSDKDMMQLVRDGAVSMFDPLKRKTLGETDVRAKFGVHPSQVVDAQALSGDSVDSVPGVPNIGVKIAAELINRYGDLETLLAHAGEIKRWGPILTEHADRARMSRVLVKLDDDAPLPCALDDLRVAPPNRPELIRFLLEMEFHPLARQVREHFGIADTPEPPAAQIPFADLDGRRISQPEAGFWLLRLVKDGPLLPACIRPSTDPANPFMAEIAGEPVDVERVWYARGEVIDRAEYNFRCADLAWAKKYAPDEPIANPTTPINLMQVAPPF